MGTATIRRFCPECGEKRPFDKERCNHGLHGILAVLTFGLWLPVWILAGLCSTFTRPRCRTCGKLKL